MPASTPASTTLACSQHHSGHLSPPTAAPPFTSHTVLSGAGTDIPKPAPRPQNAKLVVQTSGGVLLANDNADKPTFGVVVAVGEGSKNEETGEVVKPNVAVGATVMYSKYSGSEFEEADDNFIVVREAEILAALA